MRWYPPVLYEDIQCHPTMQTAKETINIKPDVHAIRELIVDQYTLLQFSFLLLSLIKTDTSRFTSNGLLKRYDAIQQL